MSPQLTRLVQIFSLISIFVAPLVLINLLGIDWLIYRGLQEAEQAELFPPPIEYLDAQRDRMGDFYYVPYRKAYCWGENVQWTSNAYNTAGGVATVRYYLQGTHRYFFDGPMAAELETARRGEKREILSLYSATGDTWRLRQGTYIGGRRAFELPLESQLSAPAPPGSRVRLYVEIDAAFSRGAGFYLDFNVAGGCRKGAP